MENNQNRMLATIPVFEFVLDDPNNGIKWKNWLRSFEICVNANRIQVEEKFNWLLHCAGLKVQEVFHSLPEETQAIQRGPLANGYNPFETDDYGEAVIKLNNFFEPKKNTSFERHIFRQMKQDGNEGIDSFVLKLRDQADKCNFDDQLEENIKDQIISGCKSITLRRKILARADYKLADVLNQARVFEAVEKQQKVLETKATNQENPVPTNESIDDDKTKVEAKSEVCKIETKRFKRTNSYPSRGSGSCSRCFIRFHNADDEKCPARGKDCSKCGFKDHFARCCVSRRMKRKIEGKGDEDPRKFIKTETVPINMVEKVTDPAQTIDEYEDVFALDTQTDDNKIWCKVGNVELEVVVDSGSRFNVVDRQSWTELKSKNIETTKRQKDVDINFNAYGGTKLRFLGMFEASIEVAGAKTTAKFYVADEIGKFLLGFETAFALKVLKIGHDVNSIDEKLESHEFNKIKNVLIDIPLKSDVKEVVQPYRRTPVPLESMVAYKIIRMLNDGIIEKVQGVSKWISPIVVTPKENDIRICVDMRRANEAVERENYPMPTFDDFLPHLEGATVFSKLDIEQAFHQVNMNNDN